MWPCTYLYIVKSSLGYRVVQRVAPWLVLLVIRNRAQNGRHNELQRNATFLFQKLSFCFYFLFPSWCHAAISPTTSSKSISRHQVPSFKVLALCMYVRSGHCLAVATLVQPVPARLEEPVSSEGILQQSTLSQDAISHAYSAAGGEHDQQQYCPSLLPGWVSRLLCAISLHVDVPLITREHRACFLTPSK